MFNLSEIAPDLYRISIFVPQINLACNHFWSTSRLDPRAIRIPISRRRSATEAENGDGTVGLTTYGSRPTI